MKKTVKSIIVLMIIAMLLIMQLPTMVLANAASEAIHNFTQNNSNKKPEYKDGQAIIMYRKGNYSAKSNSIAKKLKIENSVEFSAAKTSNSSKTATTSKQDIVVSLVSTDEYSTEDLIKMLEKDKSIMHVSKNYKVKASSITNEPYEQFQWAIENNGQNSGTEGFDINPVVSNDSEEKVIAIIDSGVDYTHSDLDDVMWENPYSSNKLAGEHGYDFVNYDDDPWDDNGHGTHCAGIIASEADNNEGTTGAVLGANNVKIMALKFLDYVGSGWSYDAISAYNYIYRAQQLGTNIVAVNNSWGGWADENDDILTEVINMVGEKGALSICAAGNEGMPLSSYEEDWEFVSPACLDSEYIVTVGASNERDELATFSNYGSEVDIAAPGTNILSTVSYNVFNPSIYTEDQISNLCSEYYNFDENLDNFKYKATEGTKVNLSTDAFGEVGGKSLEWVIEDAVPEKTYNFAIPVNEELNVRHSFSMMLKSGINEGQSGGYFILKQYDENIDEINFDDISLPADQWDLDIDYYFGMDMNIHNYWDHFYGFDSRSGTLVLQFVPCYTGNYYFNIDDFALSDPSANEEDFGKYDFYNGTSMATPFVSAAVATTSNLYKGETALQTKARILGGARFSDVLCNFGINTNGTLDLSDLENVDPEITSVTIDNDGKVEVKGYFFGENPSLYISLDGEQYELVNAEYNLDTFTFTNNELKNRIVWFKVITEENKESYDWLHLKAGIEFDNEENDIHDYIYNLTTDGNDIYYIRDGYEGTELLKYNVKTGDTSILVENSMYDLFEIYKDTMVNEYINFSSLVYSNNRIWAIATLDCGYAKESILVYYDLSENSASWNKECEIPDVIHLNGTFTTYNSDLYMIGGRTFYNNYEAYYQKEVYKYDTANKTWESAPDLPEARCGSQAVQVGDKLVLMLGSQEDCNIPKTLIFNGNEWKESSSHEFLTSNKIDAEIAQYANISMVKDGVIITGIQGDGIGETLKYNINTDKYEHMEYIVRSDFNYGMIATVAIKDKLYALIQDYNTDEIQLKSIPIESGMVELKTNITNNGVTLVDNNNKEITGTKTYLPGTKVELTANVKDGYYLNEIKVNGTAIEGNKYSTCLTADTNIEVNTGKYVSNIKLDKTSAELEIGKTLDLVATVDTEATNKNIIWKSSNENIATVSENGKVTAKAEGEAIITVTSIDGSNISAECKIKVYKPAPVVPDVPVEPEKITTPINNCSISGISNKTYTGQPLTQVLTIKNGNTVLNEGIDYTLRYSNNNNPGKATLKITGIGNYEGTITKTFIIKPKKVSGFKVKEQKTDSIKLSWSKHTGVTGYKVYSYNYKKEKWEYVGKTSNTSYTVKNLKAGTTYKYRVRAYKTVDGTQYFGSYTSSIKTKAVPSQVTGVTNKTQSTTSITVKWNKVSGVSGYELYRYDSSKKKYVKVKTTSGTSYKVTKLKAGTTYKFKVRAYKTVSGKKYYGSYSSVKSLSTKTKTPSISKLTTKSKKVTVKWKKVTGASGYEIYMATSKNGKYEKIKTITKGSTVSYTKSKLTKNKKYYFKIRTYRTVDGKKVYSSYSSVKNIKVK